MSTYEESEDIVLKNLVNKIVDLIDDTKLDQLKAFCGVNWRAEVS